MKGKATSVRLLESKEELYTGQFCQTCKGLFLSGFQAMFQSVKEKNKVPRMILKEFQNMLSLIPQWSSMIVEKEEERFKAMARCEWLEELLKGIYVVNIQILTHLSSGKSKHIKVNVPSLRVFIHRCYVAMARVFWKKPFVFVHSSTLEQQKNLAEIENDITACIRETIRESLPFKDILGIVLHPDDLTSDNSESSDSSSSESSDSSSSDSDSNEDESDDDSDKDEEESDSEFEKDQRNQDKGVKHIDKVEPIELREIVVENEATAKSRDHVELEEGAKVSPDGDNDKVSREEDDKVSPEDDDDKGSPEDDDDKGSPEDDDDKGSPEEDTVSPEDDKGSPEDVKVSTDEEDKVSADDDKGSREEDKVSPEEDDKVSPEEDDKVSPEEDDKVSPDDDKVSHEDDERSAEEENKGSPEKEDKASPEKENKASPEDDKVEDDDINIDLCKPIDSTMQDMALYDHITTRVDPQFVQESLPSSTETMSLIVPPIHADSEDNITVKKLDYLPPNPSIQTTPEHTPIATTPISETREIVIEEKKNKLSKHAMKRFLGIEHVESMPENKNKLKKLLLQKFLEA